MQGNFVVQEYEKDERLDKVVSLHLKDFTRSHIKTLIDEGNILVNNKKVKSGEKLKINQIVSYNFEDLKPLDVTPEDINFDIVYEDDYLLVVNKPQGLVVHPCSSTKKGTLVNGLLYRIKNLSGINGVMRPGIVHRLDKNTSGLMIVAKNDFSHKILAEQIKNKVCRRKYIALCDGVFKDNEGQIKTFIERSKSDRKKMAVSDKGKLAITDYKVLVRYVNKTLVEFSLQTGRTHQIRVHCKEIHHPIVGDDVYGKSEKDLRGQLLHSYYISFYHPQTQEKMEFKIQLPNYFQDFLKKLKKTDV